ncbi:MAG: hypothetical protein H3C43_01380 [Leptonema sp. (in: Bacteria)]|nr:hypothetical protein [Leptonema sp. (in: bacteria)]
MKNNKVLKVVLVFSFILPISLCAQSTLSYAEALELARKTWSERFPVEPISIFESKSNQRVLAAKVQNITVYYYRFEVSLPRLYRQSDDSISQEQEPARNAEVWLRYQPQLKVVDFAFVRDDLLPGTNRQWIE